MKENRKSGTVKEKGEDGKMDSTLKDEGRYIGK